MARRFTAVLLSALALLAACAGPEKVKDTAPLVAAFHHDLDAGRFDAIWNGGDDILHASTGEAQFIRLLDAVHRKLGKVVKSEQTGWSVNYDTAGNTIAVGMSTTFEHGTGGERFVFRSRKEGLELAGYQIDSPDMMLN